MVVIVLQMVKDTVHRRSLKKSIGNNSRLVLLHALRLQSGKASVPSQICVGNPTKKYRELPLNPGLNPRNYFNFYF
jgi:hypothetical protein